MRCLVCENISFKIICKTCLNNLLESSLNKRELKKDFFVYSFFNYNEIKNLLNSKYYFFGDRVLNLLAKISFQKFSKNFDYKDIVYIIPIENKNIKEFSHSAILAKYLKKSNIIVKYNTLLAQNKIKYAGKSLKYRQKNKRNFVYSGKNNIKVILVDDLVTTGSTLLEAKYILEKYNCDVLFALTLSDAKLC